MFISFIQYSKVTITMTSHYSDNIRNDVICDLWNTVIQTPEICNHSFSAEHTLQFLMHKFNFCDNEYLNSNSNYTYNMIRICEWEAFDKDCQHKENIYRVVSNGKSEHN